MYLEEKAVNKSIASVSEIAFATLPTMEEEILGVLGSSLARHIYSLFSSGEYSDIDLFGFPLHKAILFAKCRYVLESNLQEVLSSASKSVLNVLFLFIYTDIIPSTKINSLR